MARDPSAVRELADRQSGVASRQQLLGAGMSSAAIGRRPSSGAWTVLHPGVYRLGSGLDARGRIWAALLHACSGVLEREGRPRAAIAGSAALWLHGAVDRCPDVVEVAVPADRRVARRPGVRVRVRERLLVDGQRQPWRSPMVEALLDAVDRAGSPDLVVDLVIAVTSRRLTTPDRVLAALAGRRRLRWRRLVQQLCAQVADGVQSPLERRYLLDVERPHGLPAGERNTREAAPDGGSWYRDVRYRRWRTVVELDGRAFHRDEHAFRDRLRDNRAARSGETTLRYGWREVVADPCGIAAEVAMVLTRQGWSGAVRACRPGCAAGQAEGSFPLSEHEASA
ncbi:hypothetical protein GCM10027446_32470 [Angustibacter peucedani]